jgi:hypothetical protein
MKRLLTIVTLLMSTIALSCDRGSGSPADLPPLAPAEVFRWGGQPISVSPPTEGWHRERALSGGLRGARWVKSGSAGEEIRVAEHYALDERDRCEQFTDLLDELDDMDASELGHALQHTALYAEPPINDDEGLLVEWANSRLDQAREAFFQERPEEARAAIVDAFDAARRIRYTLDDVVERVMLSADSYDDFVKVSVDEPVESTLAGEPSVSVDFELASKDGNGLYLGRQVYVVKNNRLFVVSFLGLAENQSVFEQVLESISFPSGRCEH